MKTKLDLLKEAIKSKGKVLIAFSGGVDSSLLARVAYDVLGKDALAVTLDSETLPRRELEGAKRIAKEIGIRHKVVKFSELKNRRFKENPPERCYYCKKETAKILKRIADGAGYTIAGGVSYSDYGEYRPGIKAADEEGIWHPFVELKISKKDIRVWAKKLGLSVHDKPSSACLSSRIPYGIEITTENLKRVELAEDYLKGLGLKQVRVRDHMGIARIEVEDFNAFMKLDFDEVDRKIRSLSFDYVTLDLKGYRAGSMNEVLDL
ncbi:MAG: ATP-dependent sacrificial sulfur transferase LarE [Candidatus Altiarchaeota archaeon]|nr:ATP-dependent sacrificial sulfur transferase LarE [Candidatus Altiarchaeota archaeon]